MLLYNGLLVADSDFALPLPNRGLYFNDGFFETLVWDAGGVRYLPYHWQRMQRAAAALSLTLPPELASAQALAATAGRLVHQHTEYTHAAARVRLQLWRSGGGLYTPTSSNPDWLLTLQPFTANDTPVLRAAFAESVRLQASPVSFCKGPSALTYVLAAQERARQELDEIILVSGAGYVAETVAAAIAWIRDTTIYYPAEASGCVAGTRLAHLRRITQHLNLSWREGLFLPADLLEAEAVFTANITGIRAVQQVGQVLFHSEQHPILAQLRTLDAAANR
ncbi:hypothetical protein DNI29_17200 [Hymenobacter sediminis]|uniref:aminotransferase class IV n=1 Tax=Hymenobacter sediminis TaxID=2218621 RepID=UPI000DA6CD67|nr:aminotransferase class IV [Hymenobacter sediminis]RPD45885.1 hypothetical protein DNI29_17200 [Hymenobacter sediminis]